jgi:hypothetical protein
LPKLTLERRRIMVDMRDELLRLLESMTGRVREDALAFEVEVEDWVGAIAAEIEGVAKRVGLVERNGNGPSHGAGVVIARAARAVTANVAGNDENFVERCFGCLLSLICAQRLATT